VKSYRAPIRISQHSTQTKSTTIPKATRRTRAGRKTKRLISLAEIKEHADRLEDFPLIRRGNRLSIMPVSKDHWDFVLSLE